MEINFEINGIEVILTDEHSSSSYGIPVALMGGEAYGPGDELPVWPYDELAFLHERAATTVAVALKDEIFTPAAREFVQRFTWA